MGEDQPFRKHWLRGGRAFIRFGSAVFWSVMGSALLALSVFGGYGWVADRFLSRSFEPNGFIVAGFIFVASVLLAPFLLSNTDDNDPLMPPWRLKPPSSTPRPVPTELAEGFSFLDGVLCEEARPELEERWILIGTYGHAIVVPRFPGQVSISGLLNIEVAKPFLDPVHIRFRLGEREVLRTEFQTDRYRGSGTIMLIPRRIEISEADTFHIDMGMDGEHWTEVMRKAVIAAATSADADR